MLHLRTLGGLALQREGTALDPVNAQRKTLALLAVLASAGARGVGRDKLMLLLWPESDSDRARGALKQMLHTLRRQLGSQEAILGTAEIRLNPACVESDARCFQVALEAGDTEAAVALYRGPFLDGVHLEGTPDFDAWIEQQRGELQRSYQYALECLAQQAEGRGDWRGAVGWWQRLQAADPLNSRVAICLMLALESSGERAAALQHARIHETLLRDDWGIMPDPAVVELAERLRTAGTSPSSPSNAVIAAPDTGVASPAVETQEPAAGGAEPPSEIPGKQAEVPRRASTGHRALLALVALVAVAGVVAASIGMGSRTAPDPLEGGSTWSGVTGAPSPALGSASIAVLSFVDMTPERDQEYFGDGIAEELISHLSRVDGLRVAARTSAFQFKGKNPDVREIGERLGVAYVLEGSVRKVDNRLRIAVQLVSAEDGYHLWAETYERRVSDVFAVQDEISRAVVDALRLRLALRSGSAASRPYTASVEAYELYLRGRFFANQRTEAALVRAAEYYQQAILIDPDFARAYAGLADTYIAPRKSAPSERFRRGKEAALQALALDSTLAEAHTTMGWIKMWYDRDWPAAERHLRRAIASNPNYLWAHQWHGAYLAAVGRLEEDLAAPRRAYSIDPLSVVATTHLGTHLFLLGRNEEAIVQYRKALELDPSFFMARWGLSRAYLQLGSYEEALRELQYPGTDYLGFFQPALLGYAHAVAGEVAEARAILADLHHRRAGGEYIAPTEFAAIHLGLGEIGPALDWLERHEADRGARIFLKVDPIFDPLRSQPRFAALLRNVGLE